MRFTFDWLKEFADIPLRTAHLIDRLTMAGFELTLHPASQPAANMDGVVLGYIQRCEPHPGADRLSVCVVDVGQTELSIVCGAENAKSGLYVACAQPGAVLPGAWKIKRSKIRGVVSNGMLCSAEELGLFSLRNGGILELPPGTLGSPITDCLTLEDALVYDLHVAPNRGDCLSIVGLAREMRFLESAITLKQPQQVDLHSKHTEQLSVFVHTPSICPLYAGFVIKGVDTAQGVPSFITQRLNACGLQPKHPVVDITNYLMLESGQPLHAFDLDKIEGDIHVRFSHDGEELILLNGERVVCDTQTLLIADNKKPLAIAGIMGCQSSAITLQTKNIFLEGAWFDPSLTNVTVQKYCVHSEAAYRFARGVDYAQTRHFVQQAACLIEHHCTGQVGPVTCCLYEEHLPARPDVVVHQKRAQQILGFDVDDEGFQKSLLAVSNGQCVSIQAGVCCVTPPSYRFDLVIEEDFVEEILRYRGYDSILDPPLSPVLLGPEMPSQALWLTSIRERMIHLGYQETISLSFAEQKMASMLFGSEHTVEIRNPISENHNVLRTHVLYSLILALKKNLAHGYKRYKAFEIGPVFRLSAQLAYEEMCHMGVVAYGVAAPTQWSVIERRVDFFDIKYVVECVLGVGNFEIKRCDTAWLHPGKAALICQSDRVMGFMGELHPRIVSELQLDWAPLVLECDMTVPTKPAKHPRYRPFSTQPVVIRDFAVIVDQPVPVQDMLTHISSLRFDCDVFAELFDVFESGQHIESGKKSVAFRLFLQRHDKTLTEEEIHYIFNSIICGVCDAFSARLRDSKA